MVFRISVRVVRRKEEVQRTNREDKLMDEMKKVPKGVQKIVEMVGKLEPQEFLGVCKILGIRLYDVVRPVEEDAQDLTKITSDRDDTKVESKEENQKRNQDVVVRPAEVLLEELIDKLVALNRTQRRNLQKLLKAATK